MSDRAARARQRLRAGLRRNAIAYATLAPVVRAFRELRHFRTRRTLRRYLASLQHLADTVARPVIVKVGANDGVTRDPAAGVIADEPRWRGLFIEPVDYSFRQLEANFGADSRFFLANMAVGPERTTLPLFAIDPRFFDDTRERPPIAAQISSFNRSHIDRHFNDVPPEMVRRIEVPVRPLDDLLDTYGFVEVHALQIDVEGYDLEALKTFDFTRFRPLCIYIEHKHLGDSDRASLRSLLEANGYRIYHGATDYCAIRRDAPTAGPSRQG